LLAVFLSATVALRENNRRVLGILNGRELRPVSLKVIATNLAFVVVDQPRRYPAGQDDH
jgi:hypothetical protein